MLLEEAGKMCLFRRKIQYLYLPVCFITQQPVASALFKDWQHSPREQHRCLQGETLTRLENTFWMEPKHSASSCGDFTLDKHSGHSRKHSFHHLLFSPGGFQTRPSTLPSLHLSCSPTQAHLAFEFKHFGTCSGPTRSQELVMPPELSSFPSASSPQAEFCKVFYPRSLQKYNHSPSQFDVHCSISVCPVTSGPWTSAILATAPEFPKLLSQVTSDTSALPTDKNLVWSSRKAPGSQDERGQNTPRGEQWVPKLPSLPKWTVLLLDSPERVWCPWAHSPCSLLRLAGISQNFIETSWFRSDKNAKGGNTQHPAQTPTCRIQVMVTDVKHCFYLTLGPGI